MTSDSSPTVKLIPMTEATRSTSRVRWGRKLSRCRMVMVSEGGIPGLADVDPSIRSGWKRSADQPGHRAAH